MLTYLSEDVDGFIGATNVLFFLTNLSTPSFLCHNPLLFKLQFIRTALQTLPMTDKPEMLPSDFKLLQRKAPFPQLESAPCSSSSSVLVLVVSMQRWRAVALLGLGV